MVDHARSKLLQDMHLSQVLAITLAMNSLPRSDINVLHVPNVVNSLNKATATVSASLFAMGTTNRYLVSMSTAVKT